MRAQPPDLGVAVSNGFHKMHLATAAREANDRGFLKLLVTGAYPTPAFRRLLRALPVRWPARLRRLEHRDEEIPLERVQVLFLPELLEQLARALARVPLLRRLSEKLTVATYRLYGRKAARALARAQGAQIYHFCAGFGGSSIDRARELGMLTLCDQALVHPRLLGILIDDRGRMPNRRAPSSSAGRRDLEGCIGGSRSLRRCRRQLPVRQGDLHAGGMEPERVHVPRLHGDR